MLIQQEVRAASSDQPIHERNIGRDHAKRGIVIFASEGEGPPGARVRRPQDDEQVCVAGFHQGLVGPAVARASSSEIDVGDHRPLDLRPAVLRLWLSRSLRRLEESINLNAEPLGICLVALAGEGGASNV